MNKGFTLIELIIVIAITVVLSAIVLFSVIMYVNKGKDSSVYGYLTTLIPSGEAFYNANGNSYTGFCTSTVVATAESGMPQPTPSARICTDNLPGVCCLVASPNAQAWVAYVKGFTDTSSIYCVDSRGMKESIAGSSGNLTNIANNIRCP